VNCQGCGQEIHGRSDRKWCSSRCKTAVWRSKRFWGGMGQVIRRRPEIRSRVRQTG